MALSATQLLELLDAAIQDVLAGRATSYSIGNRSVTKIPFKELMEERNKLLLLASRETGSGAFSLGKLGRRR